MISAVIRVARWFIFKPNSLGKIWMENVVLFYHRLEYFTAFDRIYGRFV
jgi:hypothetical protein